MGLFRRRSTDDKLPALIPVPKMDELPAARLQSPARYLGTFTAAGDKVVGQTLSAKSSSRLNLSEEALDVVRMAGSFRIPVTALRGATSAGEFDGAPVESLLVVRWEHGEQEWRTGFRLDATTKKTKREGKTVIPPDPGRWVRTISKMSRASSQGDRHGQEKGEA
jgi:hypothetical protein